MTRQSKKLIEVALPLEAINKASAREKSIRHGHPSTLHLWWARRPLAAARAVIFAQMVDDPSAIRTCSRPRRRRRRSASGCSASSRTSCSGRTPPTRRCCSRRATRSGRAGDATCAENADHPRAKELFDRHKLPAFHDPFAGGGALPLEAQRLGLESLRQRPESGGGADQQGDDRDSAEVRREAAGEPGRARRQARSSAGRGSGAQGLAEDVRYYGQWMRDEAEKRIGHLYPKVEVTAEMAKERPDLKPYVGKNSP